MTDDTNDDDGLFARAVRGTRPLKSPGVRQARPRAAPRARFTRADRERVLEESLHGESPEPGEELAFHGAAVSRRAIRRLRRGHYSIAAELDLHGLNLREARAALGEFLGESVARGHACVRVIHGKGRRSGRGGPVLKAAVDGWLRNHGDVLAFASARPADGGTGAVYVLLRRRP